MRLAVLKLLHAEDVHVQVVRTAVKVTVHDAHQIVHALSLAVSQRLRVDGLGIGDAVKRILVGNLRHRVEGLDKTLCLRAVRGVRSGAERLVRLASVGQGTGRLSVHHV